MAGKRKLYHLDNARTPELRATMEQLTADDICNFCPGFREHGTLAPAVRESQRWSVHPIASPMENSRVHLLLVATRHTTGLSELEPEDMVELLDHLQWIETHYQLDGGGLVMRFGDMQTSTASVQHQHAQIICADVVNRSDPYYKKLNFRVG
jgi:diadenosine tetraphosphate (Ap4A) HIT family hydrolase